ncbi:MAG TPA: BatA domain-containing protein [Gemmatales bacterium]|nr:BatA domain-containing protein [Gemmatales bacterium]
MFDSAINPLAWWGLTLLSVPLIIHLLNRLRFKRVRWAAMEFLLQAQKRFKRRIILEQILLLLLRCLLVGLLVALVVRPTWFLGTGAQSASWPTHHVFLLDDTLSMQDLVDARTPQGATAFSEGQRLLTELAQRHADSAAQHHWVLLRWTEPLAPDLGRPLPADAPPASAGDLPFSQAVGAAEVGDVKIKVEGLRVSALAASPLPALRQGLRYLERVRDGHKVLHIVSDFRRPDWLETTASDLHLALGEALQQRVRIRWHDVARPARSSAVAETPVSHTNVGIVDVTARPRRRAEAATPAADVPLRVVTPRLPFDLHVTVRNFGEAERRNLRLTAATGSNPRANRVIERLGGREERTLVLGLEFPAEEPAGLKPLTVRLEDPDQGDHLPADNVWRHFVQLQREIPVLLIDGDQRTGDIPQDSWFVDAALAASPRSGYRTDRLAPKELTRQTDLTPYGVIYLLNITGVGTGEGEIDPTSLPILVEHVRRGGCLVFFLGPRTNVQNFNEQIYRRGEGLFPAPLLLRPDPEGRGEQSFIDEAPDDRDPGPKMRFPEEGHPALPFAGELADRLSRFMLINRYFRVDPAWSVPAGTEGVVRLANRRPLALYVPDVQQIIVDLRDQAGDLGRVVGRHATALEEACADADSKRAQKFELTLALEALLGDPLLASHWSGAGRDLRVRVARLLDRLREGDPLVIETQGRPPRSGRVVAVMTPAAPTPIRGRDYGWNNLAAGDLGQFFFVPMMLSMQGHLQNWTQAMQRADEYRLGETAEIRLSQQRYDPQIEVWFEADDGSGARRVNTITAESTGAEGDAAEWFARIAPLQGPGHYILKLNQPKPTSQPAGGEISLDPNLAVTQAAPEDRPLAFNVDSRHEGWLTRFAEADLHERLLQALTQGPARMPVVEAQQQVRRAAFQLQLESTDEEAQAASTSWSDFSWVLFLLLGLMLLEQLLARRFSHHQ